MLDRVENVVRRLDPLPQGRAEQDGNSVRQNAGTFHSHPERLANAPAHAIGADEVAGGGRLQAPASPIPNPSQNAAFSGREVHQLGAEAHGRRAQVLEVAQEDGLQVVLGGAHRRDGTDLGGLLESRESERHDGAGTVARMAGVVRSTVYLIFESRAGLFDALAADLYDRSGYPRLLEAVRVDDAWESARGGIRAAVEILAADRDVFRALYSMQELDPESVGGTIRRSEERRAEGMAWAARRLREQGYLRPEVSTSEAAHILWIQASFEAFDLLYTGRGLPAKNVADLLVAIAERSLLADARLAATKRA